MSEVVQSLVDAIKSGDAMETENAFGAAMAEKLGSRLETMRHEVAQGMFASLEEATADEGKVLAKSIAKAHKGMKVSSFGNEHYIHHKDDPEGEGGHILIKHEGAGKFHVTHTTAGVAGSENEHSGKTADEVHAIAHHAIAG